MKYFLFFSVIFTLASCGGPRVYEIPHPVKERHREVYSENFDAVLLVLFERAVKKYRDAVILFEEKEKLYEDIVDLYYHINSIHEDMIKKQEVNSQYLEAIKKQAQAINELLSEETGLPENVKQKLREAVNDIELIEKNLQEQQDAAAQAATEEAAAGPPPSQQEEGGAEAAENEGDLASAADADSVPAEVVVVTEDQTGDQTEDQTGEENSDSAAAPLSTVPEGGEEASSVVGEDSVSAAEGAATGNLDSGIRVAPDPSPVEQSSTSSPEEGSAVDGESSPAANVTEGGETEALDVFVVPVPGTSN